jgi:energy-coupling factor transporter ATP-binding protein EcfA2
MQITRFQVRGLFGVQHVDLPIADNRIVVVGVNGIGKSTVINLFYYFIARRWAKLVETQFERVGIEIDGLRLEVSREEIVQAQTSSGRLTRLIRNVMPSLRPIDDALLNFMITQREWPDSDVTNFSRTYGIAPAQIRRLRGLIEERISEEKFNLPALENYNYVNSIIQEKITSRILFLPTYRRIEKDLKSIVPDIEERVRSYEERFGASSRQSNHERQNRPYLDLVEFGMEDVKQVFANITTSLNFFSRQQLNELTGAYLREVLRGEVESFQLTRMREFDDDEINSILARVDEKTLSLEDKQTLRTTLGKLHHASDFSTPRERYIAHFFAKLGGVAGALQERETPIRDFVGVCNRNYLVGKRLEYDRNNFTLSVVRVGDMTVDLKDLSSGEKQIVSLFSHIYLSERQRFIIIIDEPELSLSVDWQSNLLPDILASGRCEFLAAVTHSPFIYDNHFESHAVDLLQQSSFS